MKNTNAKHRTKASKTSEHKKTERLRWASRIGIFLLSFVLTTLILVLQRHVGVGASEFMIGEPAPRTLFSPFAISYVDEKNLEALRQEKIHSIPQVFAIDAKVLNDATSKVDRLFEIIHQSRMTAAHSSKQAKHEEKPPFEISDAALKLLWDEPDTEEVRKDLQALMERSLGPGIIDYQKKMELLENGKSFIAVIGPDGKMEKAVPVREIQALNEVRDAADHWVTQIIGKKRHLKGPLLEVFNAVVVPNLDENENETRSRRKKAVDSIPPQTETVKKDELIVQRGMLITTEEKARIDQVQKKLTEHKVLNQFLSVGILVLLTYFLCFLYLVFVEKKTFASLRLLLLMHSVFILTTLLCKIAALWPDSSPYLMPAALAPLLLVLLTRPQLGFLAAAVMAVLISPLGKFNLEVTLATLISGFAGTFAAFRVRKRLEFLKVGSAVGLSYFFVLFAFQMLQEYPVLDSLQVSAQGLANGLLIVTPLCFLLLPFFEHFFNLTTDITLLELSDLNHPLLKRMIVEAPGTYHHSLTVSTLAESACEAIGANALLARVGSYFHDIGKIARAEFFTENQADKYASRHEKLTPTMSCLVIMNHVKEGIELGRQHKLKERILRFIPEHQGTGVIYYFYKKALDAAKPGEKINADDFRYPGPKPQSRETAVVLLSDSTEAASRSLKEPSPESIRQLVRKIINDKFIDGQLDECDLTLRDLHKIQESFVHNLMAIFHTRVSYPAQPDTSEKPDLFEEDQFSKFRFDSLKPPKL